MAFNDEFVTPADLPPINETPEWVEHLPALITDVLVEGGPDGNGPSNFQARVLDARTRWLLTLFNQLTSNGILLKGHLETEAELLAIPTQGLKIGTAYFLEYAMRAWNGTDWGTSGSLQGDRGITLLGEWPDHLPLPSPSEYKLGDAFTWQHDVWLVVPGTLPNSPNRWENLNIRGEEGKSTYESWLEIPGNEGGSIEDFINAQKGVPGDDAYITWTKMPGNEGKSKAEWDAHNKGIPGKDGEPRAAFVVVGTKANTGELPRPGVASEAWYVGIDMYVWTDSLDNYIMIPGIVGKSAYADWLEQPGNAGKTVDEFLESLKGKPGENSTVPGPPGRNLRILGTYPSMNEIVNLPDPVDQDAYCALDTGRLWMYLTAEGGWKDLGPWRGIDGKSAFDVWLADGHTGSSLEDFWAFLRGADGRSLDITGVVQTMEDLPDGPPDQTIYGVRDHSTLYVFMEGAWLALGTFGINGIDGKSAFQEWKDDGHPEGTLEEFWAFLKGKDGQSLDYVKILTPEDPTPPEPTEANKGKSYISLDRMVWINITGSAWQEAGPFMPVGVGPDGQMWLPKGMVATNNDLPSVAEKGWAFVVVETSLTHVFDGEVWSAGIDLSSKQPGPEGQQGAPGALMPIKGIFPSVADLEAAHPTGTLGDAYLIVDTTVTPQIRDLAIWSDTAFVWINTGPAGIPGGEGKPGPPGQNSTVPGPQGSRWLTLPTHDAPSNTFNGREGDWAVNLDNKIFYKGPGGWVMWGTLVAGDVNSPLLSEGKVVRLGNTWVPVPIDSVPNPEAGKLYAQRLNEETGKMVWGAIPSIISDLVTKDGKQMCRVYEIGGTVPIWKEIAFPVLDHYDLPVLELSASATVDPKINQSILLDNTSASAKTIVLQDGKKAPIRTTVVVFVVSGSAGLVTFAPTGATAMSWNGGTGPTLTGAFTEIIFDWTGTRWIGRKGAVIP